MFQVSLVAKSDIELDTIGFYIEPYLAAGCYLHAGAPLWCDLGCCSRTIRLLRV